LSVLAPTWLRIRAPGLLDAEAARPEKWIWDAAEGRDYLLDLASVRRIDSTGVALLLHLRKRILAKGRRLVLLTPSPAVRAALKLMGMRDLFHTAANPAEASGLAGELINPASP
jgi:anti-anti-sigma factor